MALEDWLSGIGGGLEGAAKGYSWGKEMEQKERVISSREEIAQLRNELNLMIAQLKDKGATTRTGMQQEGATERTGMQQEGATDRTEKTILGAGQRNDATILGAGQRNDATILGAGQRNKYTVDAAGQRNRDAIAGRSDVANIITKGQWDRWMQPSANAELQADTSQNNTIYRETGANMRNAASNAARGSGGGPNNYIPPGGTPVTGVQAAPAPSAAPPSAAPAPPSLSTPAPMGRPMGGAAPPRPSGQLAGPAQATGSQTNILPQPGSPVTAPANAGGGQTNILSPANARADQLVKAYDAAKTEAQRAAIRAEMAQVRAAILAERGIR